MFLTHTQHQQSPCLSHPFIYFVAKKIKNGKNIFCHKLPFLEKKITNFFFNHQKLPTKPILEMPTNELAIVIYSKKISKNIIL
jgi:hypothetical protein